MPPPLVTHWEPSDVLQSTHPPHLKALEAESIHIFREVVAQADRPVLLYSIGKDSSVLLHLARKAFFPARPPFPLLHIDTTWKFRDMISFRDATAKRYGLDLRVHTNPEGLRQNINPFDHGSNIYTQVMKTDALKQALTEGRYDVAIGGARRDEERSRAKDVCSRFAGPDTAGIRNGNGPSCGTSTTAIWRLARRCVSSHCRIGPNSTSGPTSWPKASTWCRCISPHLVRRWSATA